MAYRGGGDPLDEIPVFRSWYASPPHFWAGDTARRLSYLMNAHVASGGYHIAVARETPSDKAESSSSDRTAENPEGGAVQARLAHLAQYFETWSKAVDIFWQNPELAVAYLNKHRPSGEENVLKLERRAKYYCIAMKEGVTLGGTVWKHCIIGLIGEDTPPGTNNDMETVRAEIESTRGQNSTEVLFILEKAEKDTRTDKETESWVRENMGIPVPAERAKQMGLPYPEEWVVTTQSNIDQILKELKHKIRWMNAETSLVSYGEKEIYQ